ncbi:hypothetical protein PISMIDRAFT_677141, partial [Pisolithus microcarpus 441]
MLHLRQAVCLDVSEPFMAPQSIQNEVLYMGISFSGLKSRFFAFLDQIIHHHLPDIEITIDPKFEPRVERPPKPPSPANLSDQIPSNVLSIAVGLCVINMGMMTNSITLMCHDGNVNYFNPYILVFCRHNHDIKCILSGKSAKAAMFYISDYITKSGSKTYEMLSLLSRAVARLPLDTRKGTTLDSAKMLLH